MGFYNRFCFKRNSIFLNFNLNSCNGYCLEGTAMTICLASASGAPGRKLELNKYHFLCKLRPSKTSHLKISTSDICFNTAVSNHLFIAFGAACCQSSRKLEIQQLSCQVWFLALQGSVLVWGVCIGRWWQVGWGLSSCYFSIDTGFACGLRPLPTGLWLPVFTVLLTPSKIHGTSCS